MANVTIPLLFKDLTGGIREARIEGATVGEIVTALDRRFPGLAARIVEDGRPAVNVAIVVDGRIAGDGLATSVKPDSRVSILPAFGGG